MEFSYKELAVLNKIISNALLAGEIEINDITKSIHSKIANEICRLATDKKDR